MKKFTLSFIICLAFSGLLTAQVIEDFEGPNYWLRTWDANDKSSFTLVPNPDNTGINKSNSVLKFIRDKNGTTVAGFIGPVDPFYNDGTMYYHVKVWKPRISPIWFGFYTYGFTGEPGNRPMNPQTVVHGWEELVFNVPTYSTAHWLEFNPEDIVPEGLTEDVILYVDDITMNHDPAVGSTPEVVFADFEHIPLNLMLGGAEDGSTMSIVPNPDPDTSGVNLSKQVIKYVRDKDGVAWGGFWSTMPEPVDVTTNKYIHVKVWKSRITPVKFKIEGGAAGTLEVPSKYPQTKINEWEDLVFDFSEKTGTYPTIAFMPDFEDPLTLTEDLVLYFDDIVLNNDPLPRKLSEVVINVDMHEAELTAGQEVFINCFSGGNFDSWMDPSSGNDPSTIPENEMTDPDGDKIYTLKMKLADEPLLFRFYKGSPGSYTGDIGPSCKSYTVNGSAEISYKWQVGGLVVPAEEPKTQVLSVDMSNAGLVTGEKVYISGTFGGTHGTWDEPGTNPLNEMIDPDSDGKYTITMDLPDGDYYFKFFKGSGWGGGEWPGDPNRSYTVNGSKVVVCKWGSPGIQLQMDGCNLIADGHFSANDPLPGAWVGYSTETGSVNVTDGVLTIVNNKAGTYVTNGVKQLMNDFGTMLRNDSIYILVFDAWADQEKVNRFIIEDNGTNNWTRLGTSPDFDAVVGGSEWDINLTTERTTYARTFTAKHINPVTSFYLTIWSGAEVGTVFLDDMYLIPLSDVKKYGSQVATITVAGEGGATAIAADKGTLQMNAAILPEVAWIKNVEWSVINGTGYALIDGKGVLTAIKDGKVTVKASAIDGSGVSGSAEITISNQRPAQYPIDFENASDQAWDVIANGTPVAWDLSIVSNPSLNAINNSAKVLSFIVKNDADPYAGVISMVFAPLKFTCDSFTISLQVNKPIKSPVGVKLEDSTDGGQDSLVTITNNALNAWQPMKFNFPTCAGYTYSKITIYPDVQENRIQSNIVYVDNIKKEKTSTSIKPTSTICNSVGISQAEQLISIYPNPVNDKLNVVLPAPGAVLTIYNTLGCKLREFRTHDNHTTLDVSHYTPGVYFLKVDENTVFRFVK